MFDAISKSLTVAALGLICWSPVALAGEVAANAAPVGLPVDGEGFVGARILLPQSASVIQAYLSNPMNAMRLAPEVISAQAAPQGRCQKVSVEAKGLLRPIRYVVLRCPTSVGFTEQLLESSDFKAHNVEWTLTETEGGTLVTLKSRTKLNFPVPQSTLTRVAGQSLKSTLSSLQKKVDEDEAGN